MTHDALTTRASPQRKQGFAAIPLLALRARVQPAACALVGLAGAFLLLVCAPPAALGHDLWLIPPEKADVGAGSLIQGSVGMDFPKSVRALDPKLFKRKLLIGPDGKEVAAEDDGVKDDLGLIRFDAKQPGKERRSGAR